MSLQLNSYLICGRWNIVSRKTHSVNFIAPIFGHYLSTPAKSGMAVPRQTDANRLEQIQLTAARIVIGLPDFASLNSLHSETGWESLAERRKKQKAVAYVQNCK